MESYLDVQIERQGKTDREETDKVVRIPCATEIFAADP